MKKVSLSILACLLGGCSLFGDEGNLPLFTLKSGVYEANPFMHESIAVDVPSSEASLNTNRIAITPSSYQRDYLADGEWPDRLPKVLQEVFVESFSQRWGAANVNRVGTGLATHYVIQSEIFDFSVYNLNQDQPEVHVKILVKIMDFAHRKVLDAHTFTKTVSSSSATMVGIVSAFNNALHCLLEDAIPWMEVSFQKESASDTRNHKLSRKGRQDNPKNSR